jgi:V/A-type H+/Na+-transporting ATPase subunit E
VKSIIEKIKKEGVEKSREEAAKIISQAEGEKKKILEEARKEETAIINEAKKEAVKIKSNAEGSIKQAERDVVLGLRGSIISLFDRVIKREVGKALEADTLKKMLVVLAEKFSSGQKGEIEAILSEEDRKELEKLFIGELKKEMAAGITLSPSKEVTKGFRIGEKGSEVYYDFTDEAISEALGAYLNKGLIALLSGGNGNE